MAGGRTNVRAEAVAALRRRLGHDFKDASLLEHALTHSSVGEGAGPQVPADNERLEFLGDRVLGLLVADRLVRDFPAADEGQLSARLHALVAHAGHVPKARKATRPTLASRQRRVETKKRTAATKALRGKVQLG